MGDGLGCHDIHISLHEDWFRLSGASFRKLGKKYIAIRPGITRRLGYLQIDSL
jgi:hypothetical protein